MTVAREFCIANIDLSWRLGLSLIPLAFALPALAQQTTPKATAPNPTISQPVVQALPNKANLELSAALSRLGRDPRDVNALIDAGNAAMAMGDVDAAIGFFKRAGQVSAKEPRAKAGLAGAMVRAGDPFSAIPLFDEAVKVGSPEFAIAADRGLAYDLVGDNAAAQRYYRMALEKGPDREISRRLSLSQAIAGDKRGAEATLLPQLRDQDKAAWRTRAFALAISGQTEEAVRVANTILPSDLAAAIAPYLRYMPQLTAAQKAAAANLGQFPRASEIGRDDPRVAQFMPVAVPAAVPVRVASADTAAIPRAAAPSGIPANTTITTPARPSRDALRAAEAARKAEAERQREDERKARIAARSQPATLPVVPVRVAPPEPKPTREIVTPSGPSELPAVVAAAPAPVIAPVAPSVAAPVTAPIIVPSPAIAVVQPVPAPASTPIIAPAATPTPAASTPAAAAPVASTAAPGFDLARMADSRPSVPLVAAPLVAAPLPVVAPVAAAPVSMAEAFSDLGKPSVAAVPAAGAVDITRITPAKPRPEPEPVKPIAAKAIVPSHPSRIWVQLGIGRDRAALAADWRRLSRQAPDAFKDRKGSVSEMGATNRLLAGPFDSTRAANEFLGQARKAGVDGPFLWNSPAGQIVDALPGR